MFMDNKDDSINPAHVDASSIERLPWKTPTIDDADVAGLTSGNGTSGSEGNVYFRTRS
jgi:hypothetical protein